LTYLPKALGLRAVGFRVQGLRFRV
jgi:hypothetical protein